MRLLRFSKISEKIIPRIVRLNNSVVHELDFRPAKAVLYTAKEVRESKGKWVLAQEAGELAGFMNYEVYNSGVLSVHDIIIAKEFRRKGLGTQLLKVAEKEAKNNRCAKVYLYTNPTWKNSKFYEKNGYVQEARLKKHFYGDDMLAYAKFV